MPAWGKRSSEESGFKEAVQSVQGLDFEFLRIHKRNKQQCFLFVETTRSLETERNSCMIFLIVLCLVFSHIEQTSGKISGTNYLTHNPLLEELGHE